MELFIFGRFRALPDREAALEAAIRAVIAPSRGEPGCLGIQAFRSTRDARLFYIHSRWRDEAAFELHATLPHTVRFIEQVEPLIDHELEVTRTTPIG
jgi:quinol monooxygenase YgiN